MKHFLHLNDFQNRKLFIYLNWKIIYADSLLDYGDVYNISIVFMIEAILWLQYLHK